MNKYPSFRDETIKGCWKWLEGRREDDNAEGLWRVHDKLYNLRDFSENHPGGKEWIYLTKVNSFKNCVTFMKMYNLRELTSRKPSRAITFARCLHRC